MILCMQVDILDLLYRCGKHGSLSDSSLTALPPQVRPLSAFRMYMWAFKRPGCADVDRL